MKAQTEILSYIMIFVVASGLTATAIMWGIPLIQKKQDVKNLDDVYNFFVTLDQKIRSVTKGGPEETLSINVDGILTLYPYDYNDPILNNSITFTFLNKVSNIAVTDPPEWIPITTGNTKEAPEAILGIDPPSVIFGKTQKSEPSLEVTYRLWYRGLQNPERNEVSKIILKREDGSSDKLSSTSGFIRVKLNTTKLVGQTYFTEVIIIL